MSTVQYVRRCF